MRFRGYLIGVCLLLSSLARAQEAPPDSTPVILFGFQQGSVNLLNGSGQNILEETNTSRATVIGDSNSYHSGLLNQNQASGSLNSQKNVALITSFPEKSLLDMAVDEASMNHHNQIRYSGTILRQSILERSFENSRGISLLNQSPGNLNQQMNLFLLSLGAVVELSDTILEMTAGHNGIGLSPDTVLEARDILRDSFSGFAGISMVNQSAGDLNTIRNHMAFSFTREAR